MRVSLLLSALVGAPVAAQIADGFESGNLAAWTVSQLPPVSVTPSTSAAHGGTYGARVVDNEMMLEDQSTATLWAAPNPTTKNYYTRFWFRLISSNAGVGGGADIFNLTMAQGANWSAAQICQFDFQQELLCGEYDIRPNGTTTDGRARTGVYLNGNWVLIEAASLGLGTDAGVVVFTVNGAEVVRHTGLHYAADNFPRLTVGQLYNYNPLHVATFDFDDVRGDPAPMASRVAVRALDPLRTGECGRLEISFASSLPERDGGVAVGVRAPYALDVSLTGLPLYSDATCATAATTFNLTAGATQRTAYAKPTAVGSVSVQAAHVGADLLPGSTTVSVSAGAGGGSAGGTAGGSAGGTAGGSAGGTAGGSAGGTAGGSAGGTAGGSAGGTAGGSAGGTAGGSAGGTAGGSAGGTAGGGAGGMAGGSAGGSGGSGGATGGGSAAGGGGAGENPDDSYYGIRCSEAPTPVALFALVALGLRMAGRRRRILDSAD